MHIHIWYSKLLSDIAKVCWNFHHAMVHMAGCYLINIIQSNWSIDLWDCKWLPMSQSPLLIERVQYFDQCRYQCKAVYDINCKFKSLQWSQISILIITETRRWEKLIRSKPTYTGDQFGYARTTKLAAIPPLSQHRRWTIWCSHIWYLIQHNWYNMWDMKIYSYCFK